MIFYQNIVLHMLNLQQFNAHCNSFAMCMDITETYDDMIGLRLLLYMCKAEKIHLGDRVDIRGLWI